MPKNDLFTRCYVKRLELLTKYFGDFAHVAAIEKPEQLGAIYTDDLPEKICDEFQNYLAGLWRDITPEGGGLSRVYLTVNPEWIPSWTTMMITFPQPASTL